MSKLYDVIIVGAGPAGLAAGLYSGRAKMDTLIIEKKKEGGQIAITNEIENYPGAVEGESGPSLMDKFTAQAKQFGCETVYETVTDLDLQSKIKTVTTTNASYQAKAVILTPGAFPQKIGCPGEEEFTGKGVSYCATCDAAFYEDFEVYVVGGGDSAVEEAMYLTKFARKVTLIVRRDQLRAAASIQEKAFKNPKLEIMWNSKIVNITSESGELVDTMTIEDTKTGEQKVIHADEDDGIFGIFVFIGFKPATAFLEGKVPLENGYIVADSETMATPVPGVYAAGDCRSGKVLRQVVTAAADGAIAAVQAGKYVEDFEE